MSSFRSLIVLLIGFILTLMFRVSESTPVAKYQLDFVKEAVESADKTLTLYDRVIDRVIPWKEFNETLVELDKFRKDYTNKATDLLRQIKTKMMNGMDAYFSASQNVYEWAGLAIPLLSALFDNADKSVQGIPSVLLLNKIKKMSAARTEDVSNDDIRNFLNGVIESTNIG